MPDRVHWNTSGMQRLADSQDGAHARFNGILADIRSSHSRLLGGMWAGSGTGEYTGKQNKHTNNYDELQGTFRQLIGATNNSVSNATSAMSRVTSIWS